ncbi:hypothetical protein O181_033064 [Austropuccinia psidii MF-1]|uniref:Uncharacterized protein n=1 Tax=Austropuccinia psidii MF-1 TaxID=1389203 RepID=A0A9Q3CY14_9BASI|nr:hypothetical protein [Austropuccinia psidii MF-1]
MTAVQLYYALKKSHKCFLGIYERIVKIKSVTQPNCQKCFALWVKHNIAAGLQKNLKLDFSSRNGLRRTLGQLKLPENELLGKYMLPKYLLYKWKTYRDREIIKPSQSEASPVLLSSLLTWNLNGLGTKRPWPEQLVVQNQCGIIAVQEHLLSPLQYPPALKTFSHTTNPEGEVFKGKPSSDHLPVLSNLQQHAYLTSPPSIKWNNKLLQGHGDELSPSNRWNFLQVDEINSQDELDHSANKYIEILNNVGDCLGIRGESKDSSPRYFDKASLRARMQERGAKRKLEKALQLKQNPQDNEAKEFHQAIQHPQGKYRQSQIPTPCFNEKGNLLVDQEEILEEKASNSPRLAGNLTGIYKNQGHWGIYRATNSSMGPLRIEGVNTALKQARKPVSCPILSVLDSLLAI